MRMKMQIFVTALLLCAFSLTTAQANSYELPKETSPENWVKMMDTKRKCLIRLAVNKQGKAIKLAIQSQEELCFGNNTRVEFTLDDGQVFSAYGSNGDNCEGQLMLGFGGIYRHEARVNALCQHPITSLLIKDAQNEYLFYLNEQQSKEIKTALDKITSKLYRST